MVSNVVYSHSQDSCRGYHVYQVLWKPRIRDSFIAIHEEGNKHHKHAMAVYRSEEPAVVVGHLPREIGNYGLLLFLKAQRPDHWRSDRTSSTWCRKLEANVKEKLKFACRILEV